MSKLDDVPLDQLSNYLAIDKALKDSERMYQHLHDMGKRMVDGIPALERLEGKDVALILGPTGSGKSTTANALIGGIENIVQDEQTMNFSVA